MQCSWTSNLSGALCLTAALCAAWLTWLSGCAGLPSSGIDPPGEQIYVAPPVVADA